MNTFNITFLDKKGKKNANLEVPIYCRITMNGERIELSTKRSINLKDWDKKRKRAKPKSKKLKELNQYIEQFRSRIFVHHQKLVALEEPFTLKELKKSIQTNGQAVYTLLDAVIEHNQEMERQIPKIYTYGTFKNYKTVKKHLLRYYNLTGEDANASIKRMDISFVYRLESYLYAHTECKRNGAMKVLQRLKKILTIARRKGYLHKDPFDGFQFKMDKVEIGFLSQDEIDKVMLVKLNPYLNYVRDLFVFSIYTSMAYADVMNFKLEHIHENESGNQYVYSKRKKTGEPFIIPLLPPALKIIEKYKGEQESSVFRKISNQKVNSYLKDIAKEAQISMHLTFHMARHTFGTTIAVNNGVPIETVSKIMGHSRIRTTQIYARLQEKRINEDMAILSNKLFNK